ncbi:hypothetical protein ACFYXS_34665 [Streptomyces sp. NPDC002574]|uniref:hypothetical protein n=1 Tax=Streptomyces sp. NPDC002574 TaxID=3364652 RepID=UPI0036C052C1
MTEQTRTDEATIPPQAAPEAPVEAARAELTAVESAAAEPASAELTAVDEAALPVPAAPPRRRLRDRRGLRAAVRWTAVVLVFGALGAATTYGVTQPERTKIPGLRTPDDGRWTYPALKLPKLPEDAPRPLDADHNPGGRHYADPRTLLLPAPAGAKVDKSFPDRTGWLPTADFVKVFQKTYRAPLTQTLGQETLRHIAARAWTAQDGTRAEIYLLQFASGPYANEVRTDLEISGIPVQAGATTRDDEWSSSDVPETEFASVFDESAPRGPQHVRVAFVQAGDTVAVVLMTKAGTQPAVPFHQTVRLQAQLLG